MKKMEKNIGKEEYRARPLLSTVPFSQDSISCEVAGTVSANFTVSSALVIFDREGKNGRD